MVGGAILHNDGSVTMPAGEYFVGDPCYAVPDEKWSDWLDDAYGGRDGNTVDVLLAEVDGRPVLGISTAYGDGVYWASDGCSYPVDSGLLGLVPVEVAEKEEPFGMQRRTFSRSLACDRFLAYGHGVVNLGEIQIHTADEPDEPEEEYYDDPEPEDEDLYPQGEDQ